MMKDKYPALYRGLSQIPNQYLKDNLLPMLEDEKSPLIFNGTIVNYKGEMWPMVAALPGAKQRDIIVNHNESECLYYTWKQQGISSFKINPYNYTADLRKAQRQGTLDTVKEILRS